MVIATHTQEIMETPGHFYVTLPCSSFHGLFSDNTLASYTTPLNPYIYLSDRDYEVALVELAARTYLYNISDTDEAGLSFRFKAAHMSGRLKYRLYLPSSYYKDVFDIVAKIESLMFDHPVLKQLKIRVVDSRDDSVVNFTDTDNPRPPINKCYIQLGYRYSTNTSYNMFTALDGVKFLGPLSDMFETRAASYNVDVLARKIRLKHLKFLEQNTSRALYIYTNIIEHQYLGDDKSKLLRTIILERPQGDATYEFYHKEFTNPHYVKVEGSVHRTIDINIRSVTGDLAPFAPGELLVKLHFRPIKHDE